MKRLKIAFLFLSFMVIMNGIAQLPAGVRVKAGVARAEAAEWHFVADKTVNYVVDNDVILFTNVSDDFRQLKFKITNASLRMFDVKIHFDNGDVQDVAIGKLFRRGEESRVIDLTGGLRHLEKIVFWYKTKGVNMKGKARVEVWGK